MTYILNRLAPSGVDSTRVLQQATPIIRVCLACRLVRCSKGTDNIRVEMHGKDRGIDARRLFFAGWRVPGPSPGHSELWRGESQYLRADLQGGLPASGTRERGRELSSRTPAWSVMKKRTFSSISLPMWNSSAKITAASRPFLYDFTVTRGLEPVPYRAFLHECCRYPHYQGPDAWSVI